MRKTVCAVLLALFATCGNAFAQQEDFFPGWQFGIKAGLNHTSGHASAGSLISAPSLSLSAAYQFVPAFSVRASVDGLQSKGSVAGNLYSFNYGQLNADAVLDICNLWIYKYDRLFNPHLFAGFGGNVRFGNDEAQALYASFPAENWLWENPVLSLLARTGLGADVRVTDAFAISLEIAANYLSDKYNSQKYDNGLLALDYRIDALLGVKLSLDQASKRNKAVSAAAAATAAKLAAEKAAAEKAAAAKAEAEKKAAEQLAAEKAAAEAAAAAEEADKAAKEAALRAAERASQTGIYFTIGQSVLRKSENSSLDFVVEKLEKYPEAVVVVNGYADKETGSARLNMRLSKERAEAVVKALKTKGVSEDRIVMNWFGDTERVSEIPAENRVAVCFTK